MASGVTATGLPLPSWAIRVKLAFWGAAPVTVTVALAGWKKRDETAPSLAAASGTPKVWDPSSPFVVESAVPASPVDAKRPDVAEPPQLATHTTQARVAAPRATALPKDRPRIMHRGWPRRNASA
jgi:hypothetical protein